MWQWFKELDRILRGDATQLAALERGSVEIPVVGISFVIVILGMIYGACMGTFALLRPDHPEFMQMAASAVKTPALFLVTLVITFPSLYVFNALVGSRLFPLAVLRLLIASLGVNLAVLSSLGPIVAFFSVTTTSYPFMVLLNVLVFAVAGILGLSFLLQTLHRLTLADQPARPSKLRQAPLAARGGYARTVAPTPAAPPHSSEPAREPATAPTDATGSKDSSTPATSSAQPSEEPVVATPIEPELPPKPPETPLAASALDYIELSVSDAHVRSIFRCWVIVYGVVGAQVGWLMRPFIGNPNQPFEWFRPRESNFFEAVARTFWVLIGW